MIYVCDKRGRVQETSPDYYPFDLLGYYERKIVEQTDANAVRRCFSNLIVKPNGKPFEKKGTVKFRKYNE